MTARHTSERIAMQRLVSEQEQLRTAISGGGQSELIEFVAHNQWNQNQQNLTG